MAQKSDLLQGTLDLLILKTLAVEPMHGWGISLRIQALSREVRLFVFDEPTVGVDVGTRVAIYQFIRDLCEAGAGILLISSDLPEILHLTHRAYVMYRGQLRAELTGAEITEDKVLRCFFEREAA